MCEPSLIFAGASLALSAGASVFQGVQQAGVARANANIARQQAEHQRQIGDVEASRAREQFQSALSRQRAQIAARGIQLDSPTAISLGQDAARQGFFEEQTIRTNRENRARGFDAEAQFAERTARLSLLRGGSSAAASLLTRGPDLFPALGSGSGAAFGPGDARELDFGPIPSLRF